MLMRVSSGGSGVLPADQYVASLARKRMAAGALFRDGAGRPLLVDPVYKDTWDLPGGAVEAEESPHAACRREVAEELGLDRPPGRVLAVDWVPSRPERPEGVIVVYDGGVLSAADIDAVVLGGRGAGGVRLHGAGRGGQFGDAVAGPPDRGLPGGCRRGDGRGPGKRQPGCLIVTGAAPGPRGRGRCRLASAARCRAAGNGRAAIRG